jgi:hypothetical protein
MAKTKTAPAPRLTRAQLTKYFELDARRLALQRQAKDLEALQEKIEQKAMAVVKTEGGKERTVLTCGYVLAIKDANGAVAWKSEFVRVAGSAAAEKLIAAAPKKEKLSIEPAASKAA